MALYQLSRGRNDEPETSSNSDLLKRCLKQRLSKFGVCPSLVFSKFGQTADVLPVREQDYLQLVDLTGRLVVRGKRGRLDSSLAPILDRLGLSPAQWTEASTDFRQHYRNGNLRLKKIA